MAKLNNKVWLLVIGLSLLGALQLAGQSTSSIIPKYNSPYSRLGIGNYYPGYFAAAAGVHTTLNVRSHFCLASWGGTRSHGEHVSLQGASHEDAAFQDQGASLDDTRAWKVFTRSTRTRV
jgi:hypothetical protein